MELIMKDSLSVVLIVENESKNIRQCLESISWADEIIIVDDESSDNTVEIARQYKAKVFERKMDSEGKQRNYAMSKATKDWILLIDADERVTHELQEEISILLEAEKEKVTFVDIPIRNYLGDHWIQGAGYYPARKLRLFRKGSILFDESKKAHPSVKSLLQGKTIHLNSDILHYSYKDIHELMIKFNRETTLEAEYWFKSGRKISFGKLKLKMISRFYKFYIRKKGYRYGFSGFFFSMLHALYQYMTYAKYWELNNNKRNTTLLEETKNTTEQYEC